MTVKGFRRLALSLPEAFESAHMGHPDFRVKGKIFATLLRLDDQDWGMVKLTAAQQRQFVQALPEAFVPVKGGWGARGATQVLLAIVDQATLRTALLAAWRNVAPKRLLQANDPPDPR
jgi:hypothetical protein